MLDRTDATGGIALNPDTVLFAAEPDFARAELGRKLTRRVQGRGGRLSPYRWRGPVAGSVVDSQPKQNEE